MIPHLHPHAGDCEHACCLKIEHLSVRIGGEAILDDINLHMHCGQMVALIGPNGAGKSTLIRAILGQRDYEGKITFHEASGKQTKLRIGYVPQSPAFDCGDPVSVMDLFTCCIFRRPAFLRPTKAMREKVLACLENVHGEALIDKRIGARELLAVMGARLERHVHRCAAGVLAASRAVSQRATLGILLPVARVLTLANHAPVAHDDRAHQRVGVRMPRTARRKLQRPAHERSIEGLPLAHPFELRTYRPCHYKPFLP